MKGLKYIIIIISIFIGDFSFGQETLPVYADYLSDNVYLLHPAAAGIGNCSKLRLTGRQQWMGNDDALAPQLQTLSFHTRFLDNNGAGFVVFNDKNGYHSQVGAQGTYAYHIMLDPYSSNQISFGMSAMFVRNTLDESGFTVPDPVITQQINSKNYFNADAGVAFHYEGFSSYFTAKNLVLSARNLYNDKYEDLNLRRYIGSMGYYFGDEMAVQIEPSVMFQFIERTQEKFLDANIKIYKPFDNGDIWGGVSYRKGFDFGDMESPNYLTPIFGINFQNYMLAYSYTHQQNNILYADGGYHQLTFGFNFMCKDKFTRQASCPNLSGGY